MSYFPCKKCGQTVGVVGRTIYSCSCKVDPAAPAVQLLEGAQCVQGEVIDVPEQMKIVQRLNASFASIEEVKTELAKVPGVLGVDAHVEVALIVRTTIPHGDRGNDLAPLFNVEQQLLDKYPGVLMDFQVTWEYKPDDVVLKVPDAQS